MPLTQPFNQYLNHNAPQDYVTDVGTGGNDKAAIDLAAAQGAVFLPKGTYSYVSSPPSDFGAALGQKRIYGEGNLYVGANKRARYFSAINAAPTPSPRGNPDTAFNGDWSKCSFPIEHRVTGAATLGQPTTGYLYTQEAYPHYINSFNSSGHNEGTGSNTGRTAYCAYKADTSHSGQGDAVGFNASTYASGVKVGATHWLASPAACLFNGSSQAGANGVYLNPTEYQLDDNGFDVAGIGAVYGLHRSVPRSALGTYWAGVRPQSGGAAHVDDAFVATGKYMRVFNAAFANLTADQAAFCMKAAHRFYANVTTSDPLLCDVDSYGSAYFSYETAGSLNSWSFNNPIVANGLFVSKGAAGSNRGMQMQTAGVNRWRAVADGTSESGSDAGSNLKFERCDDSGATIDAPLYLIRSNGGVRVAATGGAVGFYGTNPVVKQTGVAVSAAGVHAALVNLGLIAA